MKRLPQIALLPDGKRLHLQDGPIDLIVEAKGPEAQVQAAYAAAVRRFTGLLDEAVLDNLEDGLKLTWVFDIRDKANPISISTFPTPAERDYAALGGHMDYVRPLASLKDNAEIRSVPHMPGRRA